MTKRVVQPNFAVKLGLSSESSRFILLCLLYLGQYRRLAANDLQVEFVGYRPPGQIDTCCHSLLSQPVVTACCHSLLSTPEILKFEIERLVS